MQEIIVSINIISLFRVVHRPENDFFCESVIIFRHIENVITSSSSAFGYVCNQITGIDELYRAYERPRKSLRSGWKFYTRRAGKPRRLKVLNGLPSKRIVRKCRN